MVEDASGAAVGIIAYGSSHWAIEESRDQLRPGKRPSCGVSAPAGLSVHDELGSFIDRYQRVYVVEQNRDAQMLGLMRLELSAERIAKLRSVRHYSGLPIDARSVTDDILVQEGLPEKTQATPAALTAGE